MTISTHRCLHRDVTLHVGVQAQHPQGGAVCCGIHHARADGKRHHSGQHVAAVGRGVHRVFVGLQLGE